MQYKNNNNTTEHLPIKLIPMGVIREMTGLKDQAIHNRVNEGLFPTPVKLSKTVCMWVESEVQEWLKDLLKYHRKEIHPKEIDPPYNMADFPLKDSTTLER